MPPVTTEPLSFVLEGQIVDLFTKSVAPGRLVVKDGKIVKKEQLGSAPGTFIIPPYVNAHVHHESCCVAPSEVARHFPRHGVVATVSDPHEIVNVVGVPGLWWMAEDLARRGKTGRLKTLYGVPSCVPSCGAGSSLETAGAVITPRDVEELLPSFPLLSEMMNFPGVLFGDANVLEMLAIAKRLGVPIDGHAPGLRGADAERYANAGPSTDHECTTLDEARDKVKAGMKIIIREGSAARNFDALWPLLLEHPGKVMFCADDKHPDELALIGGARNQGDIDALVRRSVDNGVPVMDALCAASLNAVSHYRLPVGLLREGDPADFLVIDDLKSLRVLKTYIDGRVVAENGNSLDEFIEPTLINNFNCDPILKDSLQVAAEGSRVRAVGIIDGQLVTEERQFKISPSDGYVNADPQQDLCKLVVINRYHNARPAVGFVSGFGFRAGTKVAIGSSVAHDCHNVVVAGNDDEAIAKAANAIIKAQGGIALVSSEEESVISFPIGGIMSNRPAEEVGRKYRTLDEKAKSLGSPLRAPFMTLSFLALPVIPALKLSDKGLIDSSMKIVSNFLDS